MLTSGDPGPPMSLLSIGHSNVTAPAFVELLRTHGIEVIADIRSVPRSGYVPHFDSRPLRDALADAGIEYVFLGRELGGRPDADEYYDDAGHVLYGELANCEQFQSGINRLLTGARTYRVAMMCSEEDPLHCHRHLLVGRVLRSRGVHVGHIRGDGRVQTEEDLAAIEAEDRAQGALFDPPAEERPWRSTRSVSRRRAQLTSSEH